MKTLKIAAIFLILSNNIACSQKEKTNENEETATSETAEAPETTDMPNVASKQDVPDIIANAFKEKFANATDVSWGKEDENEFEAEFKIDGRDYSANYDTKGTWLETEYTITKEEIPAGVNDAINKSYNDYEMKESEKSETKDGVAYEFEFIKDETRLEVAFDESGKQLKKEDISNEDESND